MEGDNAQKLKWFSLAFVLTLVLLAIIMVATVAAVQPGMPGPADADTGYTYTPVAQDAITLLIAGAPDTPGDFILLRYNPQYGQIPLTVLPQETLVETDDGVMTLRETLDSQGYAAAKRAVQTALGVRVDRYISVGEKAFRQFMTHITSVPFTLPRTFSYLHDGASVNLQAGDRRLDAQDILDLQSSPDLRADPAARASILGDLYARAVNENLDAFGEPTCERLFTVMVNLVKTDLNAADFELRRESAEFLSQVDAVVCANIEVPGQLLPDGGYLLGEEGVARLRKYHATLG